MLYFWPTFPEEGMMPEIQHTFFIFLHLTGLMANVYADKIMVVWFAGWSLDR